MKRARHFATKLALALVILSPALAVASCSAAEPFGLLSIHSIWITTPPLPSAAAFLGEGSFRISWRGAGGRIEEKEIHAGGSFKILLPRGEAQAILAIPYVGERAFKPAGALYPSQISLGGTDEAAMDSLRISFETGWLAALWRMLEDEGYRPELFDFDRLEAEMEKHPGDPWRIAPGGVAGALAAGHFRSSFLDPGKTFEAYLPMTSPWISESLIGAFSMSATAELPIYSPEKASEIESEGENLADDEGLVVEVQEGIHFFYGIGYDIILRVDEKGGCEYLKRRRTRKP